MSGDDLTTAILREIRDEIVNTRTELKAEIANTRTELKAEIANTRAELKAEIAGTNERLDVTNERLAIVETTLQDLATQQLMLTRYVGNVVDRHETAIDDLRDRVTRLETKTPQ